MCARLRTNRLISAKALVFNHQFHKIETGQVSLKGQTAGSVKHREQVGDPDWERGKPLKRSRRVPSGLQGGLFVLTTSHRTGLQGLLNSTLRCVLSAQHARGPGLVTKTGQRREREREIHLDRTFNSERKSLNKKGPLAQAILQKPL